MAPTHSIPPTLPPSVEEAYRRKCVQLKQRTSEVEEANDASRLRLARLKRQIEKMRLERAFLLQQLERRTSTNVEDSEGSPSPPPTPKEKPLRIKRGHRKPSLLAAGSDAAAPAAGATFISQNPQLSPSSDAFSHNAGGAGDGKGVNGVSKGPKKPRNAFEIYCADTRPALDAKAKEEEEKEDKDGEPSTVNVEEELARGWKDLPEKERSEFEAREEAELLQYQKEKEAIAAKSNEKKEADEAAAEAAADATAADEAEAKAEEAEEAEEESRPAAEPQAAGEDTPAQDEDVEMANDEDETESQGDKADD